jgi:hypothetical protein
VVRVAAALVEMVATLHSQHLIYLAAAEVAVAE